MPSRPPVWPVQGRRLLVTGGAGFLGRAVCRRLEPLGPEHVFVPRSREHDLRTAEGVRGAFAAARPHAVIHLAANVGGIAYNRRNPATLLHDNALMGLLVLEEAQRCGVERLLATGTVCAYPRDAPLPFRESALWDGFPEPSNAPYGLAKRLLIEQARAYRRQHGLEAFVVLPTNLYGPGDSFDHESSHVIPALLRRLVDARDRHLPSVTVWGSGNATREFLHVDDAARGIVAALQHHGGGEPVNLGTGVETAIRELAGLLKELTGFRGDLVWDVGQPDGQPRRCLDVSRARESFGFRAEIPLREGLAETVRWYERQAGGRVPG